MSTKYEYIVFPDGSFRRISSDELMHWKYIKKEKKNGRWVYYYDQSALDKAHSDYKNALIETGEHAYRANEAKLDAEYALEKNAAIGGSDYREYNSALKRQRTEEKATRKAAAKADSFLKKYNTMKVSTFAARTISKGIVKVANFFSKLFGKKK